MKQILFTMILLSTLLLSNYIRSSVGVVSDGITGLHWQDEYNGGAVKQASWQNAIYYCEALTFDGGGWRLPNRKELFGIINFRKYYPALNILIFKNTIPDGEYWTSTTAFGDHARAGFIDFLRGLAGYHAKSDIKYVRCVR